MLGIDPFELRLKNANRIGDTSPNGVVYTDPSTVADDPGDRRRDRARAPGRLPHDDDATPREGELLPEHLVAPARKPGGPLMAVHTGRGIAAIEYPTGMNQNGDPSQAWIKVKPDGRVDVFAGTSDIGNGSKTIQSQIVAETIGVPYDWVTYDNSNTDSSPVCTGTFASRATFVAGKAVEKAAEKVREQILEIAGKELEIDPADLEIVDGEVIAKGAPQKKIGRPGRGRRGDVGHGELITGVGAQLEAVRRDRRAGDRQGRPAAPLRHLVRGVRRRGRGRRRDGRGAGDAARPVLRRRQGDQPDARRGADRGRRRAGPRARRARELLPVLPVRRASRRRVRLVPRARRWRTCREIDTIMIENPSADGPYGAKGIGEMANNSQPPAIAAAVYDAVGVWVTELPITPERVLRALEAKAGAAPRGQGGRLRRGAVASTPSRSGRPVRFEVDGLMAARRSGRWNGVDAATSSARA